MKKWVLSLALVALFSFPSAAFALTQVVSRIPTNTSGTAYAVATIPGQSKAYSTNYQTGTVTVTNTSTRAVIGSPISVGSRPSFVAVNSQGTIAYVSNYFDDTISEINVATNSVSRTIGKISWYAIRGTAFVPATSIALAAISGNDSVAVIDSTTGTVDPNEILVGSAPEYIAVTPSGQFAYVANTGSNNVSVINLQSRAVSPTPISVGIYPTWIAITPDGARALVVNQGSDSVSVINLATNTVEQTISGLVENGNTGSLNSVAISADGKVAFLSRQYENHLSVIDLTTMTLVSPIDIGVGSYGVSASNVDGQLLTANLFDNSLTLIAYTADVAPTPSSSSPPSPELVATGASTASANGAGILSLALLAMGFVLIAARMGFRGRHERVNGGGKS